jgi:hypothetical protein
MLPNLIACLCLALSCLLLKQIITAPISEFEAFQEASAQRKTLRSMPVARHSEKQSKDWALEISW